MGRTGFSVDLAPAEPGGPAHLPEDWEWEELTMSLVSAVQEEIARRVAGGPEEEVLDTLDSACMLESGCTPGELTVDCRDDLPVTAHAGIHWTEIGFALLADDVRAKLAEVGYRVTGDLGDPAALAAAPARPALRQHEGRLVLVDIEHGEVTVDEGEEDVPEDDVEALLADVREDPRCGCALCAGLRTPEA